MSDEINNDDLAKALIEEAFEGVDLDVDGTPCPQGEECAIHHRVDEEIIDEEEEYGRIITYIGDYVVITCDNPALENPYLMIKVLTGTIKEEEIPPTYETCVFYVGKEGAFSSLRELPEGERPKALRFVEQFDKWAAFRTAHEMVVSGVKGGDIDLSKPVEEI